jgi:hypothetical protein
MILNLLFVMIAVTGSFAAGSLISGGREKTCACAPEQTPERDVILLEHELLALLIDQHLYNFMPEDEFTKTVSHKRGLIKIFQAL